MKSVSKYMKIPTKKKQSSDELGESDDLRFSEEKSEDVEAAIASTEEETSRKKKTGRERFKSLTKKQMLIGGAIAFAFVTIIVGLSVGLTMNKKQGSDDISTSKSPPIVNDNDSKDDKPKGNEADSKPADKKDDKPKGNETDSKPADNETIDDKHTDINSTVDTESEQKTPVGLNNTDENESLEKGSEDSNPVDNDPFVDIPTYNNTVEQEDSSPVLPQAVEYVASIADGIINSAPSQPLKFAMRAFGPKSIDTYKNCETFENELHEMASIILSGAIEENAKIEVDWNNPQIPISSPQTTDDVSITGIDTNTKLKEDTSSQESYDENDSYGTNNQVKGVDEADVVKSNGKYVFAAYGTEIVVWDSASGEVLSRTGLTQHSEDGRELMVNHSPSPKMVVEDIYWGQQESKVETLLLHGDRLTAIVTLNLGDYGDYYNAYSDTPSSDTQSLVQVRVYNIESIPTDGSSLELIAAEDLNGKLIEARSIENYAHIVTTSDINSHKSLTDYVFRFGREFWGLNSTEYTSKVKEYLEEEKIIENFIEGIRDLASTNGTCDHIVQLSLFQKSDLSNATVPRDAWKSGVVGAYTEITTIDMAATINDDGGSSRRLSITNSVTGAFLPNSWGTQIYASQNYLVLATPGYSFSQSWEEFTYLMTFTFSNDGTRAQGHSTGHVPGYVLNQFSIDEWNGYLRVATTVRSKFDCVFGSPILHFEKEDTEPTTANSKIGCQWKMVNDSDNMITILELSASSKDMDIVSSIKGLGHEGEQIYAVRFMKEKAFMVTFRQTDPFYTFDLTNPSDPKQLGELKISGFSNYLHPFDQEANFMIAVGQEADPDTGRATGLQISLYNVTDLGDPTRIAKHDVNGEASGGYSWSKAQFDHKAFRFFGSKEKLIIPASVRDEGYNSLFDGFKVFTIRTDGIIFDFDIDHDVPFPCWSNSYLPERSLIHDGILTTMKGHVISAHDIETKDFKWVTNLDIDNMDCVDG